MYEDILSMILAFLGIICVIIFTYFAGKWYVRKMGPSSGGGHIKVVDRILVGKNSTIMIIDVGGTQYLVGSGEQGMSLMKELEEPIVSREMDGSSGGRFKEYLSDYFSKGKKND